MKDKLLAILGVALVSQQPALILAAVAAAWLWWLVDYGRGVAQRRRSRPHRYCL